jgi:hypothetical protein
MGTGHVECHRYLRAKLRTEPCASTAKIERESIESTDRYLLLIKSPLLLPGYHGRQELVVDGDSIRLKPYVETCAFALVELRLQPHANC